MVGSLWSLIALTTNTKDFRIEHFRHLWLKLAVMLSREDGICLKTFGIRLNYLIIAEVSWC